MLNLRESVAAGTRLLGSTAVTLTLENGRAYPAAGRLEFGEAAVASDTGTVTLRARFPNPDGVLLPGMFVRVAVPQTVVRNGILAPQQGITRDAKGNATALVVTAANTVEQRRLTTGQAMGDAWLVTAGIIGAVLAVTLRGLDNDIYFQVGLITTIGLAAKNAILIVEFAEDARRNGADLVTAALEKRRACACARS